MEPELSGPGPVLWAAMQAEADEADEARASDAVAILFAAAMLDKEEEEGARYEHEGHGAPQTPTMTPIKRAPQTARQAPSRALPFPTPPSPPFAAAEHGSTYVGERKRGQKDGYGTERFADGSTYEGQWREGLAEGHGTYRFADGATYEGEYKAGQREGCGMYTFADGAVYEGKWKAGKMEGRLALAHALAMPCLAFPCLDGRRDGRGVDRFSDGAVWQL